VSPDSPRLPTKSFLLLFMHQGYRERFLLAELPEQGVKGSLLRNGPIIKNFTKPAQKSLHFFLD
jgi:hypothetical protein